MAKKLIALFMALIMAMSLLPTSVFAATVESTGQVEDLSVLDSKLNPIEIGTDVNANQNLLSTIGTGQMAANKFGAFENEADAANGVVKLTFDVVGKPIEIDPPIDVMIIADESGSMNMYGRANNDATNTSYMPCLNEDHVYAVTGLQYKLNAKMGLSNEGVDSSAVTYLNPHASGLERIVFNQWDDTSEGAAAVIKMVEAAGIVVPDAMSGQDVFKVFAAGWNPSQNHYCVKNGEYTLIPPVENNDILADAEEQYSYWSPEYGNKYGCFDRMMLEKEAVMNLARKITNQDDQNRVAYVGFTRSSYLSLTSYGLGDNGFCSADDLADLMPVLSNTNGHDYTNYIQALYSARKMISSRENQKNPCFVVFISDGVPSTSSGYLNALLPSFIDGGYTGSLTDGTFKANDDFPWWRELDGTNVQKAEQLANNIKQEFPNIPFYTVAFNANESACDLLKKMATTENHFFNCADNSDFEKSMSVLRSEMGVAYPSGTLTDVIGDDFDLIVDADHPFTVAGKSYETAAAANADEKIDISSKTLSWTLDEVDEAGVRITFYVKLHDNKMVNDTSKDLLYQTNADTSDSTGAVLEYINPSDAANNSNTVNLPTPYVKVPTLIPSYTVTVKYVDEQGNTIADTKITAPAETGSTYDVSAWDKISIDGYTYKYTDGAMTGTLDGDKVITVVYTKLYTVIYTDGVAGETVFEDQTYSNLEYGVDTPSFKLTYKDIIGDEFGGLLDEIFGGGWDEYAGEPSRPGYTFTGWTPTVQDTVTGDAVYTATWEKISKPNKPVIPTPPSGDGDIDIPDEEVPLAPIPDVFSDDHFAYIIGYPKDYETGEYTEDQTRMPVMPQGKITRAEVATIFFRLLSDDVRELVWCETNDFSDVKQGQWFNNAISTMANMGIVTGYPDGSFQPNANITRAEFAAIAARFDEVESEYEANFTDIIGHWAEDEICHAAGNGWVEGYPDDTFRPNQLISRAEAMTLVNRVLHRLPETPEDLLDDMLVWVDNMDEDAWYYLAVQEATNSHDYQRKEIPEYETWIEMRDARDWSELEYR